MRKICIVTGSRADYGLLSGLISVISDSEDFQLQIIASCMHLSSEFGFTYREIEGDGYVIDEKVEMLLPGDDAVSVSKSIGTGVIAFAEAYKNLDPDLVVILGDRFEALAAAQTAMIANLPIAHIHGGEITEGAIDESIRHAITKMSNLHFVSTTQFKKRVIQMGELPSRVFISGAPGIDNIKKLDSISKQECEEMLNFQLSDTNILITYHPLTIDNSLSIKGIDNLLLAMELISEAKFIITYPNADAGGRVIIEKLKLFSDANSDRVLFIESLGYERYLKTLQHINCVVGNSSSGLIEVPSFNIPTVNIGDRQKGRTRGSTVIDCDESVDSIVKSVRLALSDSFKAKCLDQVNPYGEGNASNIIIETLKNIDFAKIVRKPFHHIGEYKL